MELRLGTLGGVFNSLPAVCSWDTNRLDIFGLGTDNQMFQNAWDGSKWSSSWEALGGVFTSAPSVVSWGSNRIDIFALGTDKGMFHKAWAGAWHPSPRIGRLWVASSTAPQFVLGAISALIFSDLGLTTSCCTRHGAAQAGILLQPAGRLLGEPSQARQ
ncbi:hypothetical protein VTI74DRAFT_2718 [Chaetomium olivicolor]